MSIKELQQSWDEFGRKDPLWAILTDPVKRNRKWGLAEFFKTGELEVAQVMNYIETLGVPLQRKRALDFGCGVGRLTQALSPYFDLCCGVDIAPSMVELARQYNRYGDKCTYCVNETDTLGFFRDDSFDLIYSNIVLQHMKPVYSKNYIREFLRILVPGGVLIFQVPDSVTATSSINLRMSVDYFRNTVKIIAGRMGIGDVFWKMEMYAIPQKEIVHLVHVHGGRVIDIQEDRVAGEERVSYRYCCIKE